MASRAKKKAIQNNKDEIRKEAIVIDTHYCEKWHAIYTGVTITALIVMFIMILVAPMLSANLTFSLTGKSDESQEYNFDVTALDSLIAPLRGCNSGFRFMLEKMGATFNSNEDYEDTISSLGQYIKPETVEKVNELGIDVFVNTIIMFGIFIAAILAQVFDRRCKRKGLVSLIAYGAFFIMVLYYLIFSMVLNTKTILTSSFITGGWGIWLMVVFALGYLVVNIINYIKLGKEKDNEGL